MTTLICTLNAKYIHSNLAVRLLYQLNKSRPGLHWKEFTIKENKDSIAGFCAGYNLVAFSCYIWNIQPTLDVCRRIKALNPDIRIMLGGPEVSYEWEEVIGREEVNYIIRGEGEIPFTAFLEHYGSPEKVPSLVWKKDGMLIQNNLAEDFDLRNLENIQPYADDPTTSLSEKVLYLETSRGCPYKCEFCLASLDNKVRQLPMQSIKNTLLFMMTHGRVIKFLDRTFNVKKDFSIAIFEFILQHHQPGNVFQFEITADILHPDIRKFIHDKVPKGLFRFEIGIQTLNQQANLAVQRKQNFERTRAIILELDYKVEMHLDLIVGMALDRWADIRHSFEEVFRLKAPELQLGFLKFLKGTPLRKKHQEHGFIFDPEPPYQILESHYLSRAELQRLSQLEHALEIYWNGGKARNTLKYVLQQYSSFDFLLGLGEYFGSKRDFHKYSLDDVYQILNAYAGLNYPSDRILKQLIGIDYYLHFRIKPQVIFLQELRREVPAELKAPGRNNAEKQRFLVFGIDFDFSIFTKEGIIAENPTLLMLSYNGKRLCQSKSIAVSGLHKILTD
ncbi:MAG TPA: DUF4080 domain-containing protein [Bacteroidia bacterium]|nr:DUF4080 domain-containing protein [Bacteroidia bacterium]